jgi:hypothetical protein
VKEMATSLQAVEYLDPSGIIVQSAERLALAVVAALRDKHGVSVSMKGMPPVSSAYFNVILQQVVDAYGVAALARVSLEATPRILEEVFQRSVAAARKFAMTQT